MKKLLIVLFAVCLCSCVNAQTFTPVPNSSDFARPGAGAEQWHDQWIVSGIPGPLDVYYRLYWASDFYPDGYNLSFAVFDSKIKDAIAKGNKFSFSIMPLCSNRGYPVIDGVPCIYPTFLHNQMQSESVKDWSYGGYWIPNWNSQFFITAWKNVNIALNAHIIAMGWSKVISNIDISGYGDFGEWTNNKFNGPAGTTASDATLMAIIDATVDAYPTFQCQMINATLDGNQMANTHNSPAVGAYALNKTNAHGPLGIRRESYGQTSWWYPSWQDQNPTVYGSTVFKTVISNRYKLAPITGEPEDGGTAGSFGDFLNEINNSHVSSFGNGNLYGSSLTDATLWQNFRIASKAAGYRLSITGGSINGNVISVTWLNSGNAPTYENWNVVYELRNSGLAIVSKLSSFKPRLFLPGTTTITDTITGSGTGDLYVIIKDPAGYRLPLPLAINGRNADGSYMLKTGVTLKAAVIIDTANLIVITGESNPAGKGLNSDATSVEQGVRANTKIINNNTLAFESLRIGVNNNILSHLGDQLTHGFEIGLANAVDAAQLSQPTYLVKAAGSGGRIGEFLFNGTSRYPAEYGWSQTIGRIDAAIAYLKSIGKPYKITVWQSIGINDYGDGTTAAQYQAGMEQFRADFRARYGNNIPFLIAQLPSNSSFNSNLNNMISSDPFGLTSIIDISGATFRDPGVHWDYGGLKLIAGRMVAKKPAIPPIIIPPVVIPPVVTNCDTVRKKLDTTISSHINKVVIVKQRIVFDTTVLSILVADTLFGSHLDTLHRTCSGAATLSLFTSQIPASATDNDHNAAVGIEVGMKFKSSVAGVIKGIRFYKTAGLSGTHTGELYSSTGVRLASIVFTGETTTGWQTMLFSSPVPITAQTTYTAAMFSSAGFYVEDNDFFKNVLSNAILSAQADGTGGAQNVTDTGNGQGNFKYSSAPVFPDQLYKSANYYVDVIFSTF